MRSCPPRPGVPALLAHLSDMPSLLCHEVWPWDTGPSWTTLLSSVSVPAAGCVEMTSTLDGGPQGLRWTLTCVKK